MNIKSKYIEPKFKKESNPRIGLLALSTDLTIESDFQSICHSLPIDLFVNRIHNENPLTKENLLKMYDQLESITEKILKNVYCIIHLAGLVEVTKSFENPIKYNKANVIGTLNILKAAKKAKVKKFVYAASASCYGNSKKSPSSEKSDIQILSPYALTKWIAEQLVMSWSKIYKLSSISLRFFNVYGSRSKNSGSYSSVINVFIKQKLSKKAFTIVGDGKQTRSFIYVTDVVNAIIKAAKSKISGEIFNVGGDKSVQIKKLAKLLGGKKIYIAKRLGELKYSSANIKKIQKKLNWKPKIDIKNGLQLLLKEF